MSEYKDFTSLPPDKEQAFIIYEKTSVESAIKAKKIGMIVSGLFGLIVVIIALSFDAPKNLMADDPATQLESAKPAEKAAAPTPAPTEPKTEEAATDTPAEGAEGATPSTTDSTTEDAPTDGEATDDEAADGEAAKDE